MDHECVVMNDGVVDVYGKEYGWVVVFDSRIMVDHCHDAIVSSTPYPHVFVS